MFIFSKIVDLNLIVIRLFFFSLKVSAFAGDQFKLPEQNEYMTKFFSLFYASISTGSLISTAITPVLRAKVYCFGDDDCYPLAFGVPSILMVTAIGEFLLQLTSFYKINSVTTNRFDSIVLSLNFSFIFIRKILVYNELHV